MQLINSIQIIGTGNRMYINWKKQLERIIERKRNKLKIVEIQDVDEILDFDLESIPAIAINGIVIIQNDDFNPKTDNLEELFYLHLKKYLI